MQEAEAAQMAHNQVLVAQLEEMKRRKLTVRGWGVWQSAYSVGLVRFESYLKHGQIVSGTREAQHS
jgi:hypothetical protein